MSKLLDVLFVTRSAKYDTFQMLPEIPEIREIAVLSARLVFLVGLASFLRKFRTFFLLNIFHINSCTIKIDPAYLITVFSYVNSIITHFFLCFYSHPLFLGQCIFEFLRSVLFPRGREFVMIFMNGSPFWPKLLRQCWSLAGEFYTLFFHRKKTIEGFKGRFAVGLSLFAGLHPQMESSTTSRRTLQLSE